MCLPCRALNWLGKYIFGVLLWLDEGFNVWILPWFVLIGMMPEDGALDDAHRTVSQYLGFAAIYGSRFAMASCQVLTLVWGLWIKKRPYSHCYDAIHDENGNLIPESESEG